MRYAYRVAIKTLLLLPNYGRLILCKTESQSAASYV